MTAHASTAAARTDRHPLTGSPSPATIQEGPSLAPSPASRNVSLGSITAEVAALYGLSVRALREATRRHDVSHPRQHAMALMRAQRRPDGRPRYSYTQIARHFGLASHTTAAHAVKAFARRGASPDERA